MNVKPHTHTPTVARRYEIIGKGPWEVTYGDTTVQICRERKLPLERQIIKATRKAIKKHDEGSVQAEKHKDFSKVAQTVVSEWGKV